MLTIEEFAEASRHPVYTFESKMARAYRSALVDLESLKRDFENPLLRVDAEKRLAEIQSDIENFMNIVGSHSRRDVGEKLNRCKLDIANAKRQARDTWIKAIRENPDLSPDNVEKLRIVQVAFAKRDNIIAELKPVVADLGKKINRAEEILKKYG
jgi:hypothetical protein